MPVQLDPVEGLLAVVGVKAIISKEVERVRKSELKEAANLQKKVERLAGAVVRGDLVDVSFSDFNYKVTLHDLSETYKPDQVEAMVAAFPLELHDEIIGFTMKAAEVFNLLQAKLPKSTYVTAAGSVNLAPNEVAIHSFVSLLEVLDDPLRVLPLMTTGSILKSQIGIVRQVYPSLSAVIDAALVEAVINEKAKKKSFELPPAAEVGVNKWFGRPAVSPALQAALQANFKKPNAKPPAPRRDGRTNALAKEALSPAQKAAFVGAMK